MLIVDVKEWITKQDGTRISYGIPSLRVTLAQRQTPDFDVQKCKGAVGLFAGSENGRMPELAEHRNRNAGCSLGDCFDGLKVNPLCRLDLFFQTIEPTGVRCL